MHCFIGMQYRNYNCRFRLKIMGLMFHFNSIYLQVNYFWNKSLSHGNSTNKTSISFLPLFLQISPTKEKRTQISRSPFNWWPLCESNTVPTDYESAALTKHELRGRKLMLNFKSLSTVSNCACRIIYTVCACFSCI